MQAQDDADGEIFVTFQFEHYSFQLLGSQTLLDVAKVLGKIKNCSVDTHLWHFTVSTDDRTWGKPRYVCPSEEGFDYGFDPEPRPASHTRIADLKDLDVDVKLEWNYDPRCNMRREVTVLTVEDAEEDVDLAGFPKLNGEPLVGYFQPEKPHLLRHLARAAEKNDGEEVVGESSAVAETGPDAKDDGSAGASGADDNDSDKEDEDDCPHSRT
ncbi:hypothetical protein GGF32_009777 [Allomyces javanicus]|nr:hypothetical protein GGF32_009777 [Allomyces javanicus]